MVVVRGQQSCEHSEIQNKGEIPSIYAEKRRLTNDSGHLGGNHENQCYRQDSPTTNESLPHSPGF